MYLLTYRNGAPSALNQVDLLPMTISTFKVAQNPSDLSWSLSWEMLPLLLSMCRQPNQFLRLFLFFPMQSTRPMPSKCQLHTWRLSWSQAGISTTQYSRAFDKVVKHLYDQSDYPQQERDNAYNAVFPSARASWKEGQTSGCNDVFEPFARAWQWLGWRWRFRPLAAPRFQRNASQVVHISESKVFQGADNIC